MLRDARDVPSEIVLEADVCVVGAGAAGIALARELIGTPLRVVVLESGGLVPGRRTRALLRAPNVGAPYYPLDWIRTAALGGTTDQWGGQCRPLDEVDFEARPEIPRSGWPFGRAHLLPYYRRAHAVCQLGPFAYDAEHWADRARPAWPLDGGRVGTAMFQMSPPTRFGAVYRAELAAAPRVAVYLHASATELETSPGGERVTHVRVACLRGPRFRVAARVVVLAAGGIETPRLLLLSGPAGLGNAHDLVGRCFMEHLHLDCGTVRLADARLAALYAPHFAGATCVKGTLVLSADTRRQEGLLGYSALVDRPPLPRPRRLALGLLRRLVPERVAWRLRTARARRRRNPRRERGPRTGPVALVVHSRAEQAPNPESRVTLGAGRDALGRRRAELHWRLSPLDKRSMRRALEILGEEVTRAGIGRWDAGLDADDLRWARPPGGGHHHMGTTRMHEDPRQGVVGADARVHGIENLYVAGPSVFPTGGYANPVLTIVALALRLADHLRARRA